MKLLVMIALLAAMPVPALAHKVIAAVFASGEAIEGEIGFSNGDMAAETEVIVYGPDGAELGRTRTDADGFFLYQPTAPVDHRFRADLGAGHVADVTMPAAEVAEIMGAPVAPNASTPEQSPKGGALSQAQTAEIAEMLRDELRPLRREIAASREHQGFQSILGGIGYICGLFGLGFYLAARRKLADESGS